MGGDELVEVKLDKSLKKYVEDQGGILTIKIKEISTWWVKSGKKPLGLTVKPLDSSDYTVIKQGNLCVYLDSKWETKEEKIKIFVDYIFWAYIYVYKK